MSADNWAICPRCYFEARDRYDERMREALASYGQVTPNEYERRMLEARQPFDEEAFRTFREDYEFYGAQSGTITADYGGECQTCGLNVSFRHEQPFYKPALAPVEATIVNPVDE